MDALISHLTVSKKSKEQALNHLGLAICGEVQWLLLLMVVKAPGAGIVFPEPPVASPAVCRCPPGVCCKSLGAVLGRDV